MNIKDKLKVMDEIEAANRQHVEEWKNRRTIKGILIDTVNGSAEVVEIDKDLDAYYRVLNCRCIDIARRTIGGRAFEIICDDEATLVENPMPSAISPFGSVMLYGNLFVVRFDGKDDVESLTDEEIAHVKRNLILYRLRTDKEQKTYTALANVGYCGGRF